MAWLHIIFAKVVVEEQKQMNCVQSSTLKLAETWVKEMD